MHTTLNRAIFLDFDGVLFDTLHEVYAMTMIALGHSFRVQDLDFKSKHFIKFSQFRYLIGPAWNYYYLAQSIEKKTANPKLDLETEYKKLLARRKNLEHRSFEKSFFNTRKKLREKNHNQWLSLISPYNIVSELRGLISDFRNNFFLVTTRDRESVLELLNLNNLKFSESHIFTKMDYVYYNSKANIIQDLIGKHKIAQSIFIDDLEEHLEACRSIKNLLTIQAKWGYVVPSTKEDNSASLLQELEKFIQGENVRA